jgi:hypothetical protein
MLCYWPVAESGKNHGCFDRERQKEEYLPKHTKHTKHNTPTPNTNTLSHSLFFSSRSCEYCCSNIPFSLAKDSKMERWKDRKIEK